MKKVICLLLSVIVTLTLSGCESATPLKEKLIIQGIAVDFEEDRFAVTLQIYAPSGDTADPSKSQKLKSEGKTVYEALKRVDENVGKQSYYADTKVVVFSLDSLKQGLWRNLEFFIRSSEMGSNVCIAATEGKAADLLDIEKEGVNMPARVLANALHYGRGDSRPVSGELMTVAASLLNPLADVSLPILAVKEQEKKKVPRFKGVLCFSGETPVCTINEEDKWAYNFMHQYYDDRAFVVDFQKQTYSLQIRKTKRTVKTQVVDDTPRFHIEIELECDVMETGDAYGPSLSQLETFQKTAARRVENLTRQTVEQVLTQSGSDVFDLFRVLKKQHPDYVKRLDSLKEAKEACGITCSASVTVSHIGQGNLQG